MLFGTRMLLASALGVAILLSAQPRAQAAEPTPAELKKAIDDLKKVTADLDALKSLTTDIESLRKKIALVEGKVDLLEYDLLELKKKLNAKSSTSLRPSNDDSQKGMARLRFINSFPEEMSVVVNGKGYRLFPGDEKVIPVPAGEYTYQVLQIQRSVQTRRIEADEIKTLTIFQR